MSNIIDWKDLSKLPEYVIFVGGSVTEKELEELVDELKLSCRRLSESFPPIDEIGWWKKQDGKGVVEIELELGDDVDFITDILDVYPHLDYHVQTVEDDGEYRLPIVRIKRGKQVTTVYLHPSERFAPITNALNPKPPPAVPCLKPLHIEKESENG